MFAQTLLHEALTVALGAAEAQAPQKESLKDLIVGFFHDGGPFLYVNIFWLAAALAVAVERIITLFFRYNLDAPPFMEQITKLVMAGNPDRAVKLCGAAPNSPLAKVVRAGLNRANLGDIEVAKAI